MRTALPAVRVFAAKILLHYLPVLNPKALLQIDSFLL